MLKRWFFRVLLLIAVTALGAGAALANGDGVARITNEDAKAMLGKKDTSIIDVRTISDWKESGLKIKGAVREDPLEVESWASHYPKDRTLILYCA
jgi:rhodanese-related sulfurtransferase